MWQVILTIQNGTGTYPDIFDGRSGGGILVANSGAKIIHNIITNNKIETSTPDIAIGGVGIEAYNDQTDKPYLVIKHNAIIGDTGIHNAGPQGGGVYGAGGDFTGVNLIVLYNNISNNYAMGAVQGVGFHIYESSGIVKRNLFNNIEM